MSSSAAANPGSDVPSRGQASHEMPDPLRADVRLLGELLGQVLAEYGGEELFADVERLRELTIGAHAEGGLQAVEQAEALVAGWEPIRAEEVARAFTCYFHLVNLAEEFHRVRVLREREAAAGAAGRATAPADSIPAALAALAGEIGDDAAAARLQGLEFRPVLTAHPTEARRRAVAAAIRRISELLAERDDPRLGGTGLLDNRRRLLAEIDGLWRTAQLRMTKPSPLDEVRTAMGVFDETLFQTLPVVYRRLDDGLLGDEAGAVKPVAPPFVRLGSWIGADRDGNPNVTARVTRAAAAIASEHILIALERAATRIGRALTLDAATTPASPELDALWQRQRQLAEDLTSDVAERSPNEPYRRVLLVVAERLAATRRRDADLAYADAGEFEADLHVVQNSLLASGATRAAYADLQQLIWQVQTFGFHLAELEVRQHSAVHAKALADIDAAGSPGAATEEMTGEVLEVFRTISTLQRRYGVLACRRYIISFTQKAEDIAAVYRLAELALGSPEAAPVLDVIPLFETFDDLTACVDILDEVLTSEIVARRLAETDRRMEVMLGYSDSAKDVGPVSATLAIYDAQRRIAEWAKRNDITLTLFHGRGGALGRGGGPANRAVLAQPPGSVDGRFKLTEQGEVIFARYGDATIAARHIEQVAAATLLASAPSTEERNAGAAKAYRDVAELMDRVSRDHYHGLVKADGFATWFTEVTPQEEIGLLSLGSRPARRGLSVESLEDLRAIPWVFAWTQARVNLTGWFGLGTAMAAVGDVDRLRRAYAEWPLFTTMLDNVEMSLAKTDDRIARRYLDLGDRDDLAAMVLDELALTTRWVLDVTGHDRLLSGRRVLGRAVELRNPYVDALSFLQLRALRALRGADAAEAPVDVEQARRLLLLSVNGIAAGLQNTG